MSADPLAFPPLVDELGQPVPARSDDYIESVPPGGTDPFATAALPPLGWNGGKPDGSRMVGWTVTPRGKSTILEQHAFSINPQAITRSPVQRNQMFATQAAFYVDDFGPGSETIQITQLVAHGRGNANVGGALARATAREDVLRFWEVIYTKVTQNPGQYTVYWHDNHLWEQINSKSPEPVYFPQQAFQLSRNVQLHNVWQLQVTMGTLTPAPAASRYTGQVPGQPKIKVYVVRKGDTLKKIAARLAGKHASHHRMLQIEQQIVALTKKYGDDDISKPRTINIFNHRTGTVAGTVKVKRMHIAAGEKIILPTG